MGTTDHGSTIVFSLAIGSVFAAYALAINVAHKNADVKLQETILKQQEAAIRAKIENAPNKQEVMREALVDLFKTRTTDDLEKMRDILSFRLDELRPDAQKASKEVIGLIKDVLKLREEEGPVKQDKAR